MRYAIETQDGVFVRNGDTPFPEGSVYPAPVDYDPPRYYKIMDGQVVEKSDEEKRIVDLPSKYRRYENNQWVEMTQEEKDVVDQAEAQAAIDAENARQAAKTLALKTAENNFLLMCDQLTGSTSHTKMGFADLNAIVENIQDAGTKLTIAVKLLALDAECKREGGLLWWDDCKWHEDIVE